MITSLQMILQSFRQELLWGRFSMWKNLYPSGRWCHRVYSPFEIFISMQQQLLNSMVDAWKEDLVRAIYPLADWTSQSAWVISLVGYSQFERTCWCELWMKCDFVGQLAGAIVPLMRPVLHLSCLLVFRPNQISILWLGCVSALLHRCFLCLYIILP